MTAKDQIEMVQRMVADESGVTVEMMRGPSRGAVVVWARQVAIWICRELDGCEVLGRRFHPLPLKYIGQMFGGRCHGTILHSLRAVNSSIEVEKTGAYLHGLRNRIFEAVEKGRPSEIAVDSSWPLYNNRTVIPSGMTRP